jgi:hypothetical protein
MQFTDIYILLIYADIYIYNYIYILLYLYISYLYIANIKYNILLLQLFSKYFSDFYGSGKQHCKTYLKYVNQFL